MVDVHSLLQSHETETVEFKERWEDDRALRSLAAFANTHGGFLLVGVSDHGRVVGWEGGPKEIERISNKITQNLRIHPVQLKTEKIGHQNVLIIEVTPSATAVGYHGHYYRRVGNTTHEIPPEELGRFLMDKAGVTWETETAEVKVKELDEETLRHFTEIARPRLPLITKGETPAALLQKIRVMPHEKMTRAAILLFGKDPQQHFLTAHVHMGRFKDAITIVDDKLIEGNLFQQLDQVMSLFRQYLQVRYEIPREMGDKKGVEALQRREIWDYPLEALREATVNALIHRDYGSQGNIEIRVYDDKVVISNPGGLPAGLSVDDLKKEGHASILRNPLLAQVFYFASLVERWGSGTLRIAEACRAQGLPDLKFESKRDAFAVSFFKNPYTDERLVALGLNERQIKAVLWAKQRGHITNREYRKLTEISDEGFRKDMTSLVEKKLFKSQGKGRSTRYILVYPGD